LKIYRFDAKAGQPIGFFGSDFIQVGIVRTPGAATVSCMYLAPQGLVGYHPATVPQLFVVVQGEGWARGQAPGRLPIAVGQAAFWEAGEWHETGTDTGLAAIVIEGEGLSPGQLMPAAADGAVE
jgi:hypothetical protein